VTVADPVAESYHSNLTLGATEQGILAGKLRWRTSSLESDKEPQANVRYPTLEHRENKDSFVAFNVDLLRFEGEDGDEPISQQALDIALFTTESAFVKLRDIWKTPRIATDGGGGLRLTWRKGERELRAVIPADTSRSRYLYVEQGSDHHTVKNFTSMTLCDKVEWLLGING
jgi:hypothetical protein